jgi:hypothetical protein
VPLKRSSGLDVCSCLINVNGCLDGQTCASKDDILSTLCNFNFGRTFGDCDACQGYTAAISDTPAIAGEIIADFDALSSSLASAIPLLVPEIDTVTFSPGSADNTYTVEVTLASGIVSGDLAYNKLVYQLSRIFDVVPGTFSWSPMTKRQTSSMIELIVVDEEDYSGASALLAPLSLIVLLLQFF